LLTKQDAFVIADMATSSLHFPPHRPQHHPHAHLTTATTLTSPILKHKTRKYIAYGMSRILHAHSNAEASRPESSKKVSAAAPAHHGEASFYEDVVYHTFLNRWYSLTGFTGQEDIYTVDELLSIAICSLFSISY
jgi:hypothetical protein